MSEKRLQVNLKRPMSLMEPRVEGGGKSKLSTDRNWRRSTGTVLSGSGSIWSKMSLINSFESRWMGGVFIFFWSLCGVSRQSWIFVQARECGHPR